MALPGEEFSCTGLAITIHPEPARDEFGNTLIDANGKPIFRLGFKVRQRKSRANDSEVTKDFLIKVN